MEISRITTFSHSSEKKRRYLSKVIHENYLPDVTPTRHLLAQERTHALQRQLYQERRVSQSFQLDEVLPLDVLYSWGTGSYRVSGTRYREYLPI
jgi:hypothetical protein